MSQINGAPLTRFLGMAQSRKGLDIPTLAVENLRY